MKQLFLQIQPRRYDITPQQQERVAAVFRSFGYEQPIPHDQTTECYYFKNA